MDRCVLCNSVVVNVLRRAKVKSTVSVHERKASGGSQNMLVYISQNINKCLNIVMLIVVIIYRFWCE